MHTKEQEKCRMGQIRMWKTRAAALACSVEVRGEGDTGNLSEGYQFDITCGAGNAETTYHHP